MDKKIALTQFCLRLGDTNLILGHRLSEMCSRAPFLEEDIALANFALDHIGQAEALLKYAGELEGLGRTEDDLAYLRPEWEFHNAILAEQPNTDFAFVIARQFLLDVYLCLVYENLQKSTDSTLAGMATRFLKEAVYHCRHSGSWVMRLGGGTDESRTRIQRAFNELWKFTGELFVETDLEKTLVPDSAALFPTWKSQVENALSQAGLEVPQISNFRKMTGHTEHLGHILTEMQYLQRAFPDAAW